MTITSAIVLFSVIWFMVLFVMLPIGLRTQGDVGETVPGTHESAPADFRMRRMALRVTAVSVVLWVLFAGVIASGWITVADLDWFGRGTPPAAAADGGTDG